MNVIAVKQTRRQLVAVCSILVACTSPAVRAASMPATMPGTMATTMPSEITSPGVAMPVTQPVTQPTTMGARSADDIVKEVEAVSNELDPMLGGKSMTDAATRASVAPKVLAGLTHLDELATELENTGPQGTEIAARIHAGVGRYRLIFDDPAAVAAMKKKAADPDPNTAYAAQKQLLFADWIKSNKDPAVQDKLLTQAEALAKSHAQDPDLTQLLFAISQMDPATPELKKRATDAGLVMNNPAVQMAKQQMDAEAKLAALTDKPLAVSGTTVDGKAFSTADWKGKVVLVDFWATWCGPCREELPRVKKTYADFHARGLEILGVSNDYSADALKQFVSADAGMPWPQLLDAKAAAEQEWNPITLGYGIIQIPTMFLIDKKGVCRSVNAREDFETQIPKLLAE